MDFWLPCPYTFTVKILTIEITEIVRTVNCIIMGNTTSGS